MWVVRWKDISVVRQCWRKKKKKGIAVTFVRDRNGINNIKKRISPQKKKKNRRRWRPWGTAMIGWRGGLTTRPPPLCNEGEETADWLRIFSSSSTKRRILWVEAMFLFSPSFLFLTSLAREPSVVLEVCARAVGFSLPSSFHFIPNIPASRQTERERKETRSLFCSFVALPGASSQCGPLAVFAGDLNARLVNLPTNGIQIGLT